MFHGAIKKIKVAHFNFLWTAVLWVILFLHSSTASGNNKEYLTDVFKY